MGRKMNSLVVMLITMGLVTATPSSPLRYDKQDEREMRNTNNEAESRTSLDEEAYKEAYIEYLESQVRRFSIGLGPLGLSLHAPAGGNSLGYGHVYNRYNPAAYRESEEENINEDLTDYESKMKGAYLEYLENQKRLIKLNAAANLGSLAGFNLNGGLGLGQTGLGAGAYLGPLAFQLGGGLGLQQTGLGGGAQLGGLGLGASTGFSNGNIGLDANAGLGNNFLSHGNRYMPYVYARSPVGPLGGLSGAGIGNRNRQLGLSRELPLGPKPFTHVLY